MSNADQILAAREYRNNYAISLAAQSDVITVKANVPGCDKRVKESFLIIRYFINRLSGYSTRVFMLDGADGQCAIMPACGDNLKLKTTELEECTPIGRFADLDVYPEGGNRSLSRGRMRKCYICDNAAFVCARQGNHTTRELLNALKCGTREYFSACLYSIVDESLKAELNLENKFGLVTPSSNGSHNDLNYAIMKKSHEAIIPYLVKLFWVGFDSDSPDGMLAKLRPIGLEAERAMYSAVGTNTYKGFIFVAGILLASAGYLLSTGGGNSAEIFTIVQRMCRGITRELQGEGATFGIQAYRSFGFTGVRGHAENGFYAVCNAEIIIDEKLSRQSLLKALTHIVGDIEDTVLLKRSRSLEKYLYFKEKISSVDINDENRLKLLNAECMQNGISIGGSADVLASAIMLKRLRTLWYFDS